ncbi:swirm domain protein [Gregarina niphandrodes]|uniref:Swirm domain protein n=1 Tax=Gregarina niphandrodes TaxID=110365 RepID=A0A023BBQ0_GRENI|nr:swirm domain protein [Gregarina niphandrodes]EZG79915.1 swirm domain protein [Gregarina niphandrodes]|eukprot:XP_011134360.1 swirm domain protein [Gregarina niphandrodes]
MSYAAFITFSHTGEDEAIISSIKDQHRNPLELQSLNDVLSDYEEKDELMLSQCSLPESLKVQLKRTALSFSSKGAGYGQAAGPMGAGPMSVGPMGAGPMSAGPMGAGPMGAGPMGPAGMGAAGMGPAGMGPAGMGPAGHPRMTPSVYMPAVAARDVSLIGPPPLPPCQWFDPTGITETEVDELKCSFPDLRPGVQVGARDANSWAYIHLRNTLIDVYRSNPGSKLTLAECRKYCDGDLAALIRLLSFLERHRLVNFALDTAAPGGSQLSNQSLLDPATKKLKEELSSHWTSTPTCNACDRICLYSFYVLSPSIYGSCLPFSTLRTAIWCQDCIRDLPNNNCLLKVNLPALHVPGGTATWSDQQITALFDAIDLMGPDWVAVSKAVSSIPGNPIRTPRECLAAFLSMPLSEQPQQPSMYDTTQSWPQHNLGHSTILATAQSWPQHNLVHPTTTLGT